MQLYVLEALDALEYALGPVESEWGAQLSSNSHADPKGENSLFNPAVIVTNYSSLSLSGNSLEGDLPPYSLNIIRVKAISKAK